MAQTRLSHKDYAALAHEPLQKIERDCRVETFHATGPGGQGVNTADSAVRMQHVPSGIVVVSRESRSQYQNRQRCLQKLREEFLRRSVVPKVRHKTRPSKASKRRRLEGKRRRSEIKQLRRPPLE